MKKPIPWQRTEQGCLPCFHGRMDGNKVRCTLNYSTVKGRGCGKFEANLGRNEGLQ